MCLLSYCLMINIILKYIAKTESVHFPPVRQFNSYPGFSNVHAIGVAEVIAMPFELYPTIWAMVSSC